MKKYFTGGNYMALIMIAVLFLAGCSVNKKSDIPSEDYPSNELAIPGPSSTNTIQPEPTNTPANNQTEVEVNISNETNQQEDTSIQEVVEASDIIASIIDEIYDEGETYAVVKHGPFDLSSYNYLEIVFDKKWSGAHFCVGILPKKEHGGSGNYLNKKIYTVSDNGVTRIPLKDFEDPANMPEAETLTAEILSNIETITVNSGSMYFYVQFNQGRDMKLDYISISALKIKE